MASNSIFRMGTVFCFVFLVQLAWYPVVIAYPIDLGTIRERIS
ncbi:unnamed protein product, partial [Rotaria magnacalcarata]